MLEITLTGEGVVTNKITSDDLFNWDGMIRVNCLEPYYKSESSLMNIVCEYINSLNPSGTKVRPNIPLDSHNGTNSTGHYIEELTFQIIF